MPDVIAILCSDIHLSHRPPIARSEEPDWYEAMARPLKELRDLQDDYGVEVICAGDVFDKWSCPPELINFALRHLPYMHAVPGQHDLPNHNLQLQHKSAYHTLVLAHKIQPLEKTFHLETQLTLHPFPWGEEIIPLEKGDGAVVNLAVVHKYVWKRGKGYHGAEATEKVAAYKKALKGYDAAVFGDNHIGFQASAGNCHVFNCGGFMRRTIADVDRRPMVGILYADGSVKPHYLDTSKDVLVDTKKLKPERTEVDVSAFIDELQNSENETLDFVSELKKYCKQEGSNKTTQIILKAIECGS